MDGVLGPDMPVNHWSFSISEQENISGLETALVGPSLPGEACRIPIRPDWSEPEKWTRADLPDMSSKRVVLFTDDQVPALMEMK